jgi:hypothetical protein
MSIKKNFTDLLSDTITYLKELEDFELLINEEDFKFYKKELHNLNIKEEDKKPQKQKTFNNPSIPNIEKKTFVNKTDYKDKKEILAKKRIELDDDQTTACQATDCITNQKPRTNQESYEDVKAQFKNTFKGIELIENPLDDNVAKDVANMWQLKNKIKEIVIFYDSNENDELQFLQAIQIAVKNYFSKEIALIDINELENKNHLESFLEQTKILKLIIAQEDVITSTKNSFLFEKIKKLPVTDEYFLKEIPLFIMHKIEKYFKNPQLKIDLWKNIWLLTKKHFSNS